mgnify:CR=1 FL=1
MKKELKEISTQLSKLKDVMDTFTSELQTVSKKMEEIDKLENKVKQTMELEQIKKNLFDSLGKK